MDRIAALPALQVDETVASFCRRAVAFGGYSDAALFGALFGTASRRPDPLLPRGLTALSQAFSAAPGSCSEEAWRVGHTHFSYYACAASKIRVERLAAQMATTALGALRPMRALTAYEWLDCAVPFCPDCRRDQRREVGYFYTCRMHVTPYVTRCAAHGVALAFDATNEQPTSILSESSDTWRFAQLSRALLCAPHGSRRSSLSQQLNAIVPPSLAHSRRAAALEALLVKRFASAFDRSALAEITRDPAGAHRVATRALSQRSQAIHPVVVVLVEMLYQDGVAVPAIRVKQRPSAAVPQANYLLERLREGETRGVAPSATARELGVSVHTALRIAHAASLKVARRPKKLIPAILDRMDEELGRGSSLAEIAHGLGVSVTTVYRRLACLPQLASRRRASLQKALRDEYRKDWSGLLAGCPGIRIKDARRQQAKLYAWLYRNDRAWLRDTLAALRRKREAPGERPRLETSAIVASLRAAAIRLRALSGRPSRITWARLLREAGARRHLTEQLFADHDDAAGLIDTTATFVQRRLHWAIEELLARQEPLNLWRVQKTCGLRPDTLDESGIDTERLILAYVESRRPFALQGTTSPSAGT